MDVLCSCTELRLVPPGISLEASQVKESTAVAKQISYTDARAHFASVCSRVREDRETVVITRRGEPEVAMIAADELESLEETAHLLRSPRNAVRLLTALHRALQDTEDPQSLESLRRELALDAEE